MVGERIDSTEDLRQLLVEQSEPLDVFGSNTFLDYRLPSFGRRLISVGFAGVVEIAAPDQVVVVKSNTSLEDLNHKLARVGQVIPYVLPHLPRSEPPRPSVAGALSINLPHILQGSLGSWRDWLLGLTVMLADGTLVKTGSHAVKSVAGYDLHKAFVGARGTLGIITEVVLRTTPLAAFKEAFANSLSSSREVSRAQQGILARAKAEGTSMLMPTWIQRTTRRDFGLACTGVKDFLVVAQEDCSTIWSCPPEGHEPPRFPNDWVVRARSGTKNLEINNAAHREIMLKLKQRFDPKSRFNSGEFGFL